MLGCLDIDAGIQNEAKTLGIVRRGPCCSTWSRHEVFVDFFIEVFRDTDLGLPWSCGGYDKSTICWTCGSAATGFVTAVRIFKLRSHSPSLVCRNHTLYPRHNSQAPVLHPFHPASVNGSRSDGCPARQVPRFRSPKGAGASVQGALRMWQHPEEHEVCSGISDRARAALYKLLLRLAAKAAAAAFSGKQA